MRAQCDGRGRERQLEGRGSRGGMRVTEMDLGLDLQLIVPSSCGRSNKERQELVARRGASDSLDIHQRPTAEWQLRPTRSVGDWAMAVGGEVGEAQGWAELWKGRGSPDSWAEGCEMGRGTEVGGGVGSRRRRGEEPTTRCTLAAIGLKFTARVRRAGGMGDKEGLTFEESVVLGRQVDYPAVVIVEGRAGGGGSETGAGAGAWQGRDLVIFSTLTPSDIPRKYSSIKYSLFASPRLGGHQSMP